MCDLKKRLARIKADYGLTQEQIATELGMSRTYMSAVASGRYPYTDSLKKKIDSVFPTSGEKQEDKKGVFIPEELVQMFNNMSETIRIQARRLEELEGGKAKQDVG